MGQKVEQLGRLAAVAQRDDHVAYADHADVPVERVLAVQRDRRSSRAVERGDNLGRNVLGLADAQNDDLALLVEGLAQRVDDADKAFINAIGQSLQLVYFHVEHGLSGFDKIGFSAGIHEKRLG